MIEPGEIVLCNVKVIDAKKRIFVLKEVIFSQDYDKDRTHFYQSSSRDRRYTSKVKSKFDLKIINIDVIARLGYKFNSTDYTEHQKSETKTRDLNGTYQQ